MKRLKLGAFLTGLASMLLGLSKIAGTQASSPTGPAALPSEADVRQILVHAVDTEKRTVGIVAGLIDSQGSRVVAYGQLDQKSPGTPGADTVYEIGSVTKVFTSLLLADMVTRGKVSLDDPVAKYLPSSVTMPSRSGKQITLVDLATHTSGLPRVPSNLKPAHADNPYADYTVDDMYAFLSSYQLTRDPGAKYEYSNLGGGLLGPALALLDLLQVLVRAALVQDHLRGMPVGSLDESDLGVDHFEKELCRRFREDLELGLAGSLHEKRILIAGDRYDEIGRELIASDVSIQNFGIDADRRALLRRLVGHQGQTAVDQVLANVVHAVGRV